MRFLVDAQLPPLLARHLINSNHQAEHVSDVRLSTARDSDILEYALTNGAVLITEDEDFVTMRAFNANGPANVWIRLGNTTRRELLTRFSAIQTSIFAALERGETIVEISSPPDV